MKSEQFVIWLQGFIDGLDYSSPISSNQVDIIRKKLKEVNGSKNMLNENNSIFANASITTTWDSFENDNQLKLNL